MKRLQKWLNAGVFSVGVMVLVGGCIPSRAKEPKGKKEEAIVKTFDAPIDKVYAGAVQVASADYNLKSAIKEAYTVNFFSGGKFSLVVSAICHDHGNGQTVVTLSIVQSQGNPQIFFVGKEKEKLASHFWAELEAALNVNEKLGGQKKAPVEEAPPTGGGGEHLAGVTVKSVPDGADIVVDGKFSGSTPSTLQLSAGNHKLTLTSKGFHNWERTISVSPGGTITVNASLEPDPAHAQ
jgi:hypothetical protein